MDSLLADDKKTIDMGTKGYNRFVEHFSEEITLSSIECVYMKLYQVQRVRAKNATMRIPLRTSSTNIEAGFEWENLRLQLVCA